MIIERLSLIAALLIITLSSYGQDSETSKVSPKAMEMAKKSDEMMKAALELTEEQIPVISKMNVEFSERMVVLYEKPGSLFAKVDDMKKIGKERKAKLEEVLTPEQMKLFKKKLEGKMRKEMRKILKKDS